MTDYDDEEEVLGLSLCLADYRISISGKEMTVEGPDEDVCGQIGPKFLSLISNQIFQNLSVQLMHSEDEKEAEQAEKQLIEILGIPRKSDQKRQKQRACESCGKLYSPKNLTQIDSGQKLCPDCLKALRRIEK